MILIHAKKIVTVGEKGTIHDGALIVEGKSIKDIGQYGEMRSKYPTIEEIDNSEYVITPSLIDCHTHLLEYAPTSLYPVTPETHFHAGRILLFKALASGITTLGEQVCGHPMCDFTMMDYRKAVRDLPIDVSFAATSISIGLPELAHFTSVTGRRKVEKDELSNLEIIEQIAVNSDYPGENIFMNATPANFEAKEVPRAGELIYTELELKKIVGLYSRLGKRIGAHVAGEEGIQLALDTGIDVIHHAHGISDQQIMSASAKGIPIIATPIGGTHLRPNSPEEILKLVKNGIAVSVSTDSYLPPHHEATWLLTKRTLYGPNHLMEIAQPSMKLLAREGFDENEILAVLTANPASLLGKDRIGRLEIGMDADFLVALGVPGLEIVAPEHIKMVYFKGKRVINRV
ncbi:amidohydrolase family protein [Chungangia koreensis]|uniref:Amidohydrolase family protein n=1 Tax=Chungangia koreensis TaxID=752657 RepID=A0ABV8WZJ8_9LACT